MNLTALEIKYTIIILEAFQELYPGEEVTINPGFKSCFWLTDRPEIYVNVEADLNQPFTAPGTPECQTLMVEILNREPFKAHA